MKVLAVTYTDVLSGAGIAALRVHRAVQAAGIESSMMVAEKQSACNDIEQFAGRSPVSLLAGRRLAARILFGACGAGADESLSGNLFPTGLHRRMNACDAALVHLHWVGREMIQIEEVARISHPIVWTLHDEWFRLGLEHYTEEADSFSIDDHKPTLARSRAFRWLDRKVAERKSVAWATASPEIVCPSRWLAQRVIRSGAAPTERVSVVPNAVPTGTFRPLERAIARERLGLPAGRPIIGAGALNALEDPRKGHRYLFDALSRLSTKSRYVEPIVLLFGAQSSEQLVPFPIHFAGTVTDDAKLAVLYSAMDVFVCPSRQENFPNTIAEALSSGIPCIAFDIGGIPDLIRHGVTGYLARPFDPDDLATGIIECLDPVRNRDMSAEARQFAESRLSPDRVASQYVEVYQRAIERDSSRRP